MVMLRSLAIRCALLASLLSTSSLIEAFTNAAYYDPYPLYTSNDPHEFLYTKRKDQIRGNVPDLEDERMNITVSFFGQRATKAKNFNDAPVFIGDIHGDWNMFGLLYNGCQTNSYLSSVTATPFVICTGTTCNNQQLTGTFQYGNPQAFTGLEGLAFGPNLGRVAVPLEYRKLGARFEAAVNIMEDYLALKLQLGVADIHQILTPSGFIDLSNTGGSGSDASANNANIEITATTLTSSAAIRNLTAAVGLDIANFKKAAVEDLRGQIIFRHAFPINYASDEWPRFLFIPFAQILGSLGTAPRVDPNKVFAVPFGNNGHNSAAFNLGLAFDFEDSLEIAFEGGGTFFSKETVSGFRVPTNPLQSGIYPCTATVCYKPGPTWHAIATLHARRFIDKLSGHVQFCLINHFEDSITALAQTPNPTKCTTPVSTAVTQELLTCLLVPRTKWDVKELNVGFNYELSPNMTLGILWQAPLKVHGAPNSNTLIGSFIANF
jgi:hypothetical protein